MDPIRFKEDLKVTMQALGWRSSMMNKQPFEEWRYLPLKDDISSTTFWYQNEPHASFPTLPTLEYIEVI